MARILVTSALPYINGVKHLGNLVGSMLPSDVFARFKRMEGHEVMLICATDEHGTPAELAAVEANQDVAEFCAEQHEVQKKLYDGFNLDWTYFGRSSSPQNRELTQHFADALEKEGLIEVRTDKQVFSIDDDRFLPDRYIEGTCPNCGFERARGDQCESCTKLLDPTDLIDPRSAVSGSTNLEVRESKQLYLLQAKMRDRLRDWINSKIDIWPVLVTSIAKKWLDDGDGLQDRCITRDLKWGVPVKKEGLEGKVFYVWFDAPIEYIAATKEWADEDPDNRDWKRWWYGEAASDVTYYQFMGKDNVPFHTVGFPVTQFGSNEPWKVVDYLKGFNWLNFAGGKFSTSQKRGVFMDHALEILPADYWRYYLMANAPERDDTNFTWDHFQGAINKDLADVLGNFINRILKFCNSKFGPEIPAGGEAGQAEEELARALEGRISEYVKQMNAMEFRKGLGELRAIWVLGNEYLTRAEPWAKFKTDPDAAAVGVRTGINLIRIFALLTWPVMPSSSEKILGFLNLPTENPSLPLKAIEEELCALPVGHAFNLPEPLFQKITDEDVEGYIERFGGGEND